MKIIFRYTVLALFLFSLLRILFYWTNRSLFDDIPISTLAYISMIGLRFDFSTILYCFFPFYLLMAGYLFLRRAVLKTIASASFFFSTVIIIIVSIFDTTYFEFSSRRISYDILLSLNDTNNTYNFYFYEYLSFIILGFILIGFILYSIKKINKTRNSTISKTKIIGIVLVGVPMYYIGMVGLGSRPLSPLTALLYVKPREITLVSNTAQSILFSIYRNTSNLEVPTYFTPSALDEIYQIRTKAKSTNDPVKRDNVVIFILESFSRAVLKKGSPYKAKTPFLDSLMNESLVFENAYANGRNSSEGVVSILGSIPSLIENAYNVSRYNNNKINGIGKMLKEKKISSSFFLGTVDNSFGFKEWTNILGIERYYSQENFKEYRKHLSPWGVFDKPYFQFIKRTLDKQQSPFFSAIFNVSSHHPYVLPKEDEIYFNHPGQTPEQNSISYVDYALSSFFEEASKAPWFYNTLFVFVADHWGRPSVEIKTTMWNKFEIPLFLYHPDHNIFVGRESKLAQQIDIIPTVLDYLNYDKSYMSFGKSLLDSTKENYVFGYHNSIYRIANDSLLLGYNTQLDKSKFLYHYRTDTLLTNNIVNTGLIEEQIILEKHIKARIQRYNMSLKQNELYIE